MTEPQFDGATFSEPRDGSRLRRQLDAVKMLMADGVPHTLREIAERCQCSEASASARLRDLRKLQQGGYTVDRKYVTNGIWEYRLVLTPREQKELQRQYGLVTEPQGRLF